MHRKKERSGNHTLARMQFVYPVESLIDICLK
jgi:hypothetical protein